MAIESFNFGPLTITRRIGEPNYSKQQVLVEDASGFSIVRRETEEEKINEVRYSHIVDGEELVFIRGYFETPQLFKIDRIENVTKDPKNGLLISGVFASLENDLRESGVVAITTSSIAKLAPILVERYGFHSATGKSAEDMRKAPLARMMPGSKAFGLIKYL